MLITLKILLPVLVMISSMSGSNCLLKQALDGRIVLSSIISLCQSAATSGIAKCFWR